MSAPAQLLLFQVGPRLFAADVRDVVRITPAAGTSDATPIAETSLGRPSAAGRGLVVREAAEERVLLVDGVLGVREPRAGDVRPLPALAAACLGSAAVRGLVLLEDLATPLIDLPTLVREGGPAAAPARGGDVHA